jgi:hypothetical protein
LKRKLWSLLYRWRDEPQYARDRRSELILVQEEGR